MRPIGQGSWIDQTIHHFPASTAEDDVMETRDSAVLSPLRRKEPQGSAALREKYRQVRAQTESLCRPLLDKEYVIQSGTHVSPPNWHLAQTSKKNKQKQQKPHLPGYEVFDPHYAYLF